VEFEEFQNRLARLGLSRDDLSEVVAQMVFYSRIGRMRKIDLLVSLGWSYEDIIARLEEHQGGRRRYRVTVTIDTDDHNTADRVHGYLQLEPPVIYHSAPRYPTDVVLRREGRVTYDSRWYHPPWCEDKERPPQKENP
jgi:hypothetical protein